MRELGNCLDCGRQGVATQLPTLVTESRRQALKRGQGITHWKLEAPLGSPLPSYLAYWGYGHKGRLSTSVRVLTGDAWATSCAAALPCSTQSTSTCNKSTWHV